MKVIGGTEYHFLKLGAEKGGQWLNEDFSKIVSEDGEVFTQRPRSIPDKSRLRHLIYDDVCHQYWFAKNVLLLNKNEITDFFFNLEFSIDKFHFKNHVDLYCQEHFDPNTKPD